MCDVTPQMDLPMSDSPGFYLKKHSTFNHWVPCKGSGGLSEAVPGFGFGAGLDPVELL